MRNIQRNIPIFIHLLLTIPFTVGVFNDNYCRITSQHTLCKHRNQISPSCGKVTSRGIENQTEKNLIVQIHNQLRAKVANGQESRGAPGPQPPAANMIELTWDEELALEAQTWADQCITDHDCSQCRTVSRFQVGQNLYSFGHIPGLFEGSWAKAINGWYDEVADYSRDYVAPFRTQRGVLVGHYTQAVWALTSKIGCGKLTYFSSASRQRGYGKQLYICNYGRAGNFIGSKLYEVGQACSKCPNGSTCSRNYPGLCSIDPSLSVTPSVVPTLTPTRSTLRPTGVTVVNSLNNNDPNARCEYKCKTNLGCSVGIKTTAILSGPTLGSCFSPFFGGRCSGTPKKCVNCSSMCGPYSGNKVSVSVKNPSDIRVSSLNNLSGGSSSGIFPNKSCNYTCKSSGGCSVQLKSDSPLNGSVLGSCFSPAFGGQCFGIPRECRVCSEKCQNRSGQSFSEIVN